MQSLFGNILAVVAIAASAILYEVGVLAPGDAFFAVAVVLLVFTANQLIARENQPLRDAVVNMFTNPRSYSGRGAFAAYVGTSAVGAIVIFQTMAYL
ncbi:hypothetical protein [Pyruvatibacter sp.]|uniref:hypothetical protein n=1 Tax=Pyruvatibacter sp. TaxID=1981328 RepID=UPI0032EF075B